MLLATGTTLALGMQACAPVLAVDFPALIRLSNLDGTDGFVINGVDDFARSSGSSVSSAGDVNGDGVDDLLIGAPNAFGNDERFSGETYVVFGGAGVGARGDLELSDLDGANGFVINGIDRDDRSGSSVSGAGDVNGDGVDDLVIGAPGAGGNRNDLIGESYVVFGGGDVGGTGVLDLAELNGANGYVLAGIDLFDLAGSSVSGAGDVNGDGVDDLLIGAPGSPGPRPDGPNRNVEVGESYVVFGGGAVGNTGLLELSELDGADGFVLEGAGRGNNAGSSVSGVGDVNGDGVDDILIGAPEADPGGSGAGYLLFGGSGVGGTGAIELSELDGADGFVLEGIDPGDAAGESVSAAGDVNGDGVHDLLIGAPRSDPNGIDSAGESYVVYGGRDVGRTGTLDLSALDGFVLEGAEQGDSAGLSVSSAGDLDDDGVDDLLIGARFAGSGNASSAGRSYVVFGGRGAGGTGSVALSDLDGSDGFALAGVDGGDASGTSVSSAGDINGDGVDDLLIGAPGTDSNGDDTGSTYVVFGIPDSPGVSTPAANDLFANAESLDGANAALASGSTLSVSGTTVGAGMEEGEPTHRKGFPGQPPGPRNSIWYRWSAAVDRAVEIDTVGSATGTVLAAYTGDSLSGLELLASAIDNNGKITRVRFAVRAGQTYQVAVDGYGNNSEGAIRLNVRQPTMDPSECTITGTNGPDVLSGTSAPDVICGLGGNDDIRGAGGADVIFAGKGRDFVSAGSGKDMIFGQTGQDVLVGGPGADLMAGGPRGDRLFGGAGDDIVFGGSGADLLSGSSGDDALFGEMGADRLSGGAGDDVLDGGPFDDTCVDTDGVNTSLNC